jgi:hypothetical protein
MLDEFACVRINSNDLCMLFQIDDLCIKLVFVEGGVMLAIKGMGRFP